MNGEPVITAGTVVAVFNALAALVCGLLDMSAEDTALVMAFAAALSALVAAYVVRKFVTPVSTVDKVMENRGEPPVTDSEYKAA